MKRLLSATWWLMAILFLALFLVACERPLQDEAILEATTPDVSEPNLFPEGTVAPLLTPSPGAAYPVPAEPDGAAPTPGEGEAETPTEGQLPTEPSATEASAATPLPEEDIIYTVVAGDTLGSIAERYGISVEEIAAANDLGNIHTLDVGQQLLLPLGPDEETVPEPTSEAAEQPPATEEQVHIVQPGDNLYRLGLRYGFTIEQLATYNNLANPNDLEVGQRILIPPEGYTIP